jgi:hypothetical protein
VEIEMEERKEMEEEIQKKGEMWHCTVEVVLHNVENATPTIPNTNTRFSFLKRSQLAYAVSGTTFLSWLGASHPKRGSRETLTRFMGSYGLFGAMQFGAFAPSTWDLGRD